MKLNRTFAILVCIAAFLTGAAPGIAGEAWRVVQKVGTVKVGGGGMMPVAITNKQDLPAGAWVETAATGRVLLMRGNETIAVAPMSRVMLPTEKVNGNTQVVQSLGSVLYQIGKEKTPHFQVNTPYLAAVVKGTTFTVSVKNGAASVEVTEGLVEVATPNKEDTEFVHPGFTATVHEHGKEVSVGATVTLPDPAKNDEPKSTSRTIVIPQAIGDINVDVKKATGGLIDQPPPSVKKVASNTSNGSDNSDDSKDKNKGDTGNNGNAYGIDNGNGGGNGEGNDGNGNGNGGSVVAAIDLPPDLGPGNDSGDFANDKEKIKDKIKD